jgi:hypothetical protein
VITHSGDSEYISMLTLTSLAANCREEQEMENQKSEPEMEICNVIIHSNRICKENGDTLHYR